MSIGARPDAILWNWRRLTDVERLNLLPQLIAATEAWKRHPAHSASRLKWLKRLLNQADRVSGPSPSRRRSKRAA